MKEADSGSVTHPSQQVGEAESPSERWNVGVHEATLPSSYCQKDPLPASLEEAEDLYLVGSSKTFFHQKRPRLDQLQ